MFGQSRLMHNKNITIGVLGGMGPYATLHFLKRILDLTPVTKDRDHFRIITDNNVKIPSRTRAVKYGEKSPVDDMVYCINKLSDFGCDYVMLPCNSAHYFYDQIIPRINIPWLNMIEIISNKTTSLRLTKPLVLGGFVTTNKKIYSKYIPNAVYLDEYGNNEVENIIEEIKSFGKISVNSLVILKNLIDEVKNSIDSVILACTELPIVIGDDCFNDIQLLDTTDEYILSLFN